MRHLDLCSGIGGFSLAATRVWDNHTPIFCEIDDYCQAVLRKHWPNALIHGDIHTFDGTRYAGTVDLLTAGFPCQPYSVAGKRGGNQDDRAIWPQVHRVIGEVRPCWVVLENVTGIITMALDGVLSDLESEGYTCGTVVLPACAVGAPHRRDRVWIVADAMRELPYRSGNVGTRWRGEYSNDGAEASVEDVGNADSQRCEERDVTAITGRPEFRGWQSTRIINGRRLPEPGIRLLAHGIPGRVARLRALGNAIVPQVAAEIFHAIKASTPPASAPERVE